MKNENSLNLKTPRESNTLNLIPTNSTYSYLFFARISVKNNRHETLEKIEFTNLRFDLRVKYEWFFRYRAALLQVQNPKQNVVIEYGKFEPSTVTETRYQLKNVIASKKRKISEYKNKLGKARAAWSGFFPIENDPLFIAATAKIERLENELLKLQS